VCGFKLTQSWRWHCEAWPDDAVSLSSWRRYWAIEISTERVVELSAY
jgi:hypothetical protein